MKMPSFKAVKKIIEDITGFIKSFTAQLKEFIGYFKKDIEFSTPDATEAPIGDGE
ncbi:MAG: hypothetical protein IJS90_00340 [Clostridia bacterium]|nr:hypothetical protein [Clostridia bacterium]